MTWILTLFCLQMSSHMVVFCGSSSSVSIWQCSVGLVVVYPYGSVLCVQYWCSCHFSLGLVVVQHFLQCYMALVVVLQSTNNLWVQKYYSCLAVLCVGIITVAVKHCLFGLLVVQLSCNVQSVYQCSVAKMQCCWSINNVAVWQY